mmetsp:Transcript_6613/g.24547  ORF Transcript_6613/g.24547 Transcript_6613/m.24547 type:complete len:207 (-) Transcript_6613:321-941(-)
MCRGRPIPNGEGEAVITQRCAPMRVSRRYVQHVAGAKLHGVRSGGMRGILTEDPQWETLHFSLLLLLGSELLQLHAPLSSAFPLNKKDVVVVDVRPDASLAGGVADHQVVQPPGGEQVELLQEEVGLFHAMLHLLDKDGPPRVPKPLQCLSREGPMLKAPLAPASMPRRSDQARNNGRLRRQLQHALTGHVRGKLRTLLAGEHAAH